MNPESPAPSIPFPLEWPRVVTAAGLFAPEDLGITDAHNHVWIGPVEGADPGSPRLDQYPESLNELGFFRQAGGDALLDCQPGGCGRDGRVLARLARASAVRLIGCTGFHLRRYYPPQEPLFGLDPQAACDLFAGELLRGMRETRAGSPGDMVYAGFIKTACQAELARSPLALLEGAAMAARQTGAAVLVHTEQGADAVAILRFFVERGLSAHKLVLCHIDKRPDYGLHRELAVEGVLLEYDTFFREKYEPERNLWPLINFMLQGGLSASLALATDLADRSAWQVHGGPGLAALPGIVQLRLRGMGLDARVIRALLGGNINRRLARVTWDPPAASQPEESDED